jgi:hypothetical protein
MNDKNGGLPGYCILLDGIIAEIAKEQGRESEEVKQAILMNLEEQR